jgi:hypothetical protein
MVQQAVESQLRGKHMLAADWRVLRAQLWSGKKPTVRNVWCGIWFALQLYFSTKY